MSELNRLNLIRHLAIKGRDLIEGESNFSAFLAAHGDLYGEYGRFFKSWSSCKLCRLGHLRERPVVAAGSLSPDLVILGEAPGPEEDRIGVPFCGPTGTLLREAISKAGGGIDVANKVFFMNALACIPKDTKHSSFRAPTEAEVRACLPRLKFLYETVARKARVILITGKQGYLAWRLLLESQISFTSISSTPLKNLLGWHQPSLEPNGEHPLVYVTYHPSYVSRQKTYAEPDVYRDIMQQWINDLAAVNKYITDGNIRHVRSR